MTVVVYVIIELIVKFLTVTEPEDSLACSLKPDIGPYSQSVRNLFEMLSCHGDEY
jgi:hypothetical protein